ncbi:purine or other phosphorylase family 1 [Thermodesulfatator indicus DSM 15286]|uniref:Uridine phosphorylase n=1 Tax=Thermodesulfatator indicus (strain DSM 15286 / JCM 11887 / CIR29812) TaxID=667014 RepID=F8AAT6_THEID|nr:purine or other phosphorylase family 1 [Thermodesulfatator indicus]AEH45447.1 purine or other phosphorylase family 1 [Thermodesulfatator indicus DSM 15286]
MPRPIPNFKSPPSVILAFTKPDCELIKRELALKKVSSFFLANFWRQGDMALCGPVLGAPQAAIVLEHLKSAGAQRILAYGWAGALNENIPLGSLFLPNEALSLEGTSQFYGDYFFPSKDLFGWLYHEFVTQGIFLGEGRVVSTDALYKENKEFCDKYSDIAQVVDMETSAIFCVGKALGLSVVSLLLVSDRVCPDFQKYPFKKLLKVTQNLIPIFRSFFF